ncbi:carbohydrate ABC transporter permease [Dactylosporangium matsuzakiense]|uniref:Sugar ABC transporter permease n=1 Tax=Dactylosporangium matsuzakiense TaxID=53360 RepID=A0A9W6KBU0_9ACTN|nr:sugar ABC transporter permease [Dactylosporangium matsuzakiense]GLK99206.1 sugar ABC transporter permease [Dactylosporangium matsuzakiense]
MTKLDSPAGPRVLSGRRDADTVVGRKRRSAEGFLGLTLMAPAVLPLLVFFVAPSVFVAVISLYKWSLLGDSPAFTGVDNYVQLVHDDRFWQAFRQTGYYALLTVPTTTVLGFVLGWALYRRMRMSHAYEAVIFSPYVLPPVATMLTWTWIFHGNFGVLNALLGKVGVGPVDWLGDPHWIVPSMAVYGVWQGTGFCVVLYLSSFGRIPREVYEAAAVDGAGPARMLRSIVLPLVSPTTYMLLIFNTSAALKVFVVSFMFTAGTGGTDSSGLTVNLYQYQQAFVNFDGGYGAAVATTLTAVIMAVLAVGAALGQRGVFYR